MQDFRFTSNTRMVLLKPLPFFGLKTNQLGCFAPSCMSCFDYVNSLADLVVGYMGAPWLAVDCGANDTGQEMLDLVQQVGNTQSDSKAHATQLCNKAFPLRQSRHSPHVGSSAHGCGDWKIGPKGLEYARFSIDSHFTRNYLCKAASQKS